MKRFVLLSVIALIASFLLSKTVLFATTAAEEEHGGDIVYTKPIKAVIFSHKAHTEDIGMQCEWCHDETFEMEALAMEAEENFNMESLCNESYCGTCHNGDISFSTTVQCARCHIGIKGYDRLVKEGKIEPDEDNAEALANHKGEAEEKVSKFDATKRRIKKDEESPVEKMVESGYIPEDITLTDNDKKVRPSSAIKSTQHVKKPAVPNAIPMFF
jgi:c(7)-type cytochrome triheme protein